MVYNYVYHAKNELANIEIFFAESTFEETSLLFF